jgi:hypothetical protein
MIMEEEAVVIMEAAVITEAVMMVVVVISKHGCEELARRDVVASDLLVWGFA